MIHQVRESTADSSRLRALIELQLQVLGLAASQAEVDQASLERNLATSYGENAPSVAKWLCRHSALLRDLNTFAAHPNVEEKAVLVGQIRSDVELLFEPKPQKLQVAFDCSSTASVDPPWKCGAGGFLMRFYDIWGYSKNPGFPDYLFGDAPIAGPMYTRWVFIDEFLHANDGLYLCAICDAAAFRTKVHSKALTGIEHFFPKSIYPHLAIHPRNLIPICTNCNNTKSDNDLMELCGSTLGIQELLLPYQQHQPGLNQMAYVEVLPRGSRAIGQHPLEIKFRPTVAYADATSLLAHFETLYHVEERWNNELDQIDEQMFRRIQQFLMADVQMGNDLKDVDFFVDRLELLMALTSMENLGKDPFSMVMLWMLKYHIDKLRQEGNDTLIYINLLEWAKEHRSLWTMLRKHVEELYSRVPTAAP